MNNKDVGQVITTFIRFFNNLHMFSWASNFSCRDFPDKLKSEEKSVKKLHPSTFFQPSNISPTSASRYFNCECMLEWH